MSVRTMARVWDASTHSGTELLMLLAIADFADDEGNAYPGVATLATKCRMKTRNAMYILRALETSGELQVRLNEGPRGTNRYRIVLEALGGAQRLAGAQGSAGAQSGVATPAILGSKPPQPIADEPSVNHQEPSKRVRRTAKRKTAISEDWQLSEKLKAWTVAEKPGLRIDQVLASFRDHYIAKGELRADWEASWRNWVRKERLPSSGPVHRGGHSGFDKLNYREGVADDGSIL